METINIHALVHPRFANAAPTANAKRNASHAEHDDESGNDAERNDEPGHDESGDDESSHDESSHDEPGHDGATWDAHEHGWQDAQWYADEQQIRKP